MPSRPGMRLIRLRIARSTARVANDDEVFGWPLHLAFAAIEMAAIDCRCRALPAAALVYPAVRNHLEPVFLRKHVTVEVERVAETTPDDHQVRLGLRQFFSRPPASKQVAKDAAGRSQPSHVAFHYRDSNDAIPSGELKTYTRAYFCGLSDKLSRL